MNPAVNFSQISPVTPSLNVVTGNVGAQPGAAPGFPMVGVEHAVVQVVVVAAQEAPGDATPRLPGKAQLSATGGLPTSFIEIENGTLLIPLAGKLSIIK